MTAKEHITAQKEITDEITRQAIERNLTEEDLEPISDGVADAEAYLSSNPKVMWVLNDPYDEFENGQPKGGGQSQTTASQKLTKSLSLQLGTI